MNPSSKIIDDPKDIQVTEIPAITNVDPVGDLANSSRVNQQQVLPTAVTNRFLNPISQSPTPQLLTSITLGDIRQTTADVSDGIGDNPQPNAIFGFGYEGTNQNYVDVELCTSIFIDEVDLSHTYPFGGAIFLSNWTIERIKGAHTFAFDGPAGAPTYTLNQANQDFEWLVVKCYESGADHTIVVQYYWRAILNTGGSKVSSSG